MKRAAVNSGGNPEFSQTGIAFNSCSGSAYAIMKKEKSEDILSVTALACGSVGALLALFVGYSIFGFPICIAATVVGGVFGASLGRHLG